MAKKKKPGEQLPLIDVGPKEAKPIIKAARLYKEFQQTRLEALKNEIAQKQVILELVKKAKLKPLEDGKIKFECDGMTISITPRDELVQVQEKAGYEEE